MITKCLKPEIDEVDIRISIETNLRNNKTKNGTLVILVLTFGEVQASNFTLY